MHAKPRTVRRDCRHGSSVSSARRSGRAEPGHVVLLSRHHPPRTCMTLEWYRLRYAVHQLGRRTCQRLVIVGRDDPGGVRARGHQPEVHEKKRHFEAEMI